MASAPFSQGRWCEASGRPQGVERHHPCPAEGARWVDAPAAAMAPTKPSTTVAAAGETRVCLI